MDNAGNNLKEHMALLPKTAVDLVELIGSGSALLLIKAFGGYSFVLNSNGLKVSDYVKIADIVGSNNAAKIRQYIKHKFKDKCGYKFYIPKCGFILDLIEPSEPKQGFTYLEEMKPYLSGIALDLYSMFGAVGFERFINAFGGKRIKIPCVGNSERYQKIKELVGEKIAIDFCTMYKGERLYIPTCSLLTTKIKHHQIVREYEQAIKQGKTSDIAIYSISQRYNLSDRQLVKILNSVVI
ncbi:Mor transcription activator family protein [Ursidibacter arcticus]